MTEEIDIVALTAERDTLKADLDKATAEIETLKADKAQLNEYIARYVSNPNRADKPDNTPKDFNTCYATALNDLAKRK